MAKLRNKFQEEPVIDFFFLNMCLFHVLQLDFSPVGMLCGSGACLKAIQVTMLYVDER